MLLPSPTEFLDQLFAKLEQTPGQLDHLLLDHICYRVETTVAYEELKQELSKAGTLLVEHEIGGRLIATYHLAKSLTYKHRKIDVFELPAPKPGRPYPTGYEHVEFVTGRPLEEFEEFLVTNLKLKKAAIDRKGLLKGRNQDLRVQLSPGISVKFHERSLADVIRDELREMDKS